MKHHLRKTKIIAAFLLTALICSMLPGGALPVSAKAQAGELPAEETDPDEEISIHVQLIYPGEEENYPLEGAGIDLYQVAELTVHGGAATYTLTADFADSGVDFTGMTASESMKAAEDLTNIVKQKKITPAASGKADAKGELTFPDLAPGIYLGVQREPVTVGKKYKVTFGESLWLAPMYELKEDESGYEWIYACNVQPKPAPEVEKVPPKKTTPPPKKTTPPTPHKTRTGDDAPVLFYSIMLGAAGFCLVLVLLLDRKKKRDDP